MNAAGKDNCTPLKSLSRSFLIEETMYGMGSWWICLLAFNRVDIVSIGYSRVSPSQFPKAEIRAILTM